jgi:hypothetical protein
VKVALQLLIILQCFQCLFQDGGSVRVGRRNQPVVHPLAFAPGRDDTSSAQIRKMARDFRLRGVDDFNKVANAELSSGHEVDEPQPSGIGKGAEKSL